MATRIDNVNPIALKTAKTLYSSECNMNKSMSRSKSSKVESTLKLKILSGCTNVSCLEFMERGDGYVCSFL